MWQPRDSSELNMTFKTCLYKAKDTYLRQKPESMQRFILTDIVSLVIACWPTTLGNVVFAKKSLLERGWTVLNYCLLDDPRLLDNPTTTPIKIDGNQINKLPLHVIVVTRSLNDTSICWTSSLKIN
jgi:hypothetical protein